MIYTFLFFIIFFLIIFLKIKAFGKFLYILVSFLWVAFSKVRRPFVFMFGNQILTKCRIHGTVPGSVGLRHTDCYPRPGLQGASLIQNRILTQLNVMKP